MNCFVKLHDLSTRSKIILPSNIIGFDVKKDKHFAV